MLATLKRYALAGSRADSMTSDLGSWFSKSVPVVLHQFCRPNVSKECWQHTRCRRVQFVNHVRLVVGIGYLEAPAAQQARHTLLLQLGMVDTQRRHCVETACQ
jgi:hypothetical protein